eukprot:298174_1
MVPNNANDGCVGPQSENAGKASACDGCPNQSMCTSGAMKIEDPTLEEVASKLKDVKNIILLVSGKGGVGKSTVACQLGFSLATEGAQVGLLDVDICGPSVPLMLGLIGRDVHRSAAGWSPVYVQDNLGVMSVGFMLPNADDAVIWRGPRKNGLIKQFLTDVVWGPLDYLIIDTPPGTSDEHISTVQYLKKAGVAGAVVVTTPQEAAMGDVRKELNFCIKTGTPVIGLVGNMAALSAPLTSFRFCDDKGNDVTQKVLQVVGKKFPEGGIISAVTDVFEANGTGPEGMAKSYSVPYLGSIPLDPNLMRACERGVSFTGDYAGSSAFQSFAEVVVSIVAFCDERANEK